MKRRHRLNEHLGHATTVDDNDDGGGCYSYNVANVVDALSKADFTRNNENKIEMGGGSEFAENDQNNKIVIWYKLLLLPIKISL